LTSMVPSRAPGYLRGMTKRWTLAEAFASFGGATGRNPRWSWSARTADGETVVMTFWKDRFDYKATPVSYLREATTGSEPRLSRPGNRERLENLIHSQDHCGGLLRVVVVVAKDADADPRS